MTKKTKETKDTNKVDQKAFDAFIADYKELVKKHDLGLVASIDYSPTGIVPKLSVAPYKEE